MQTNVLRGFVSILGAKITVLFLGLLITPILVRLLGSSQYGDYAFVLSVLGITMILTNAGIFDGTRKYIAEDRKQPNWVEHVFGFYLRVAIALALIAAVVYATFSWIGFSEQLFGYEFTVYFYLLGGLILTRQAYSVARGGLMGLGLEDRSEPLNILRKILFGLVGLTLAYLGYGVAGVLVGHIVASLTVSFIAIAILFRRINAKAVFSRVSSGFPKRVLLSFNSYSVVLILLTASLYHVDILLLRPIAGSEATGYYRAALVIAEFLWFVPNALQMVLLHSTSELWAKDQTNQISTMVSRITRYNLSLVILLAIGLAALADDFVPLYFGSGFESAVLPLLLLLPGVLGFALARPIFAVGQGKGEIRILIAATGVAAVINFILNIILIPRYGMNGAAVATSIGYGSMVVFHIIAARRIGFNPINDLRASRIAVTGLITAIVVFGTASVVDSTILSLIIVPPLGFFMYAVVSLKLGVVSPKEMQLLERQLPEHPGQMVRRVSDLLQ
ncbi:polysaccharide biosynthesis C-terminal domain-containing protein [Natrialbaceae archaeon A-CW1-1]